MKNIVHTYSGNSFHGNWSVKLRGPAAGFTLSPSQQRRAASAACGITDCVCAGNYGGGLDITSCRIDWDTAELVPVDRERDL